MPKNHYTQDEFIAVYKKHEEAINNMARHFFRDDNYYFDELRGSLIRHLWSVYTQLKDKSVIEKEKEWVGIVLFHCACNFIRDLQRENNRIPIDRIYNIENHPDIQEKRYYERMYQLIEFLDEDERNFIYLYLNNCSLKDIAHVMKTSQSSATRKMKRLIARLRDLNLRYEDLMEEW